MSHTPTAQRPVRRRLIAALTAAALAFAGAATVAPSALAAGGATVTVTEAPRDGGSVTVTGSGFAGTTPGIYLGFGPAGLPGFYQGASSLTQVVWIAPGNESGQSEAGPTAPMEEDGSFEVTIDVPAFAEGTGWALYTSKAHGQGFADPSQNTITPVSYVAPAPVSTTTTLAVSPAGTTVEGLPVALTATVSPADAAGTVTFSAHRADGVTAISGDIPVSSGVAGFTAEDLTAGVIGFSASFTPVDAALVAASESAVVAHEVTRPTEPQPTFDPAIRVFLADGTTPYMGQEVRTGDQLVVKGTGFDPAANIGGRGVPIPADLPQGTYVVFGSFQDDWKPSAGAPGSSRKAVDQRWALAEDVLGKVPPRYQEAVRAQWTPIAADGSFTTTLTAKEFGSGPEGGRWGVYAYGAGGVVNPDQELSVPVAYVGDAVTPEPAGPVITVSPAGPLDPSVENVLAVEGKGFTGPGAANGAYVLFGEKGIWNGGGPLPADGWVAQGWVMAKDIVDGAFRTTLTVPAGTLDPALGYHVATSAAHGLSQTDRSLDAFAAVSVAEPAGPVAPAIRLSADTLRAGDALTVTGAGFPAGSQVTVTVNSTPVVLGTTLVGPTGGFSVSGTVPADVAAGAHTVVAAAGGITVSAALTVQAASAPIPEVAPQPVCTAASVGGASLQWGVKASFSAYVKGPIAKGSISGGWGGGSGAFSAETGNGRVSYDGSMRFTGHGGKLDLSLSNPRIRVSGSVATLVLDVSSKGYNGSPDVDASGVSFASLSLPAATVGDGEISWSGASATLTAEGARAFAGFYSAGEALDPVSFTFPLGATVPCDATTDAQAGGGGLAATGAEADLGPAALGAVALLAGLVLVAVRRRHAAV
ncbi:MULTISPECIES: HtaA domain-containing protein [Bacteria]|uniref:HtaA domain-containing protein n=1 Tax=Bacteria TaxID=2 RepID=UPI003C7AECF1